MVVWQGRLFIHISNYVEPALKSSQLNLSILRKELRFTFRNAFFFFLIPLGTQAIVLSQRWVGENLEGNPESTLLTIIIIEDSCIYDIKIKLSLYLRYYADACHYSLVSRSSLDKKVHLTSPRSIFM